MQEDKSVYKIEEDNSRAERLATTLLRSMIVTCTIFICLYIIYHK
jgi:hypothetical protein